MNKFALNSSLLIHKVTSRLVASAIYSEACLVAARGELVTHRLAELAPWLVHYLVVGMVL